MCTAGRPYDICTVQDSPAPRAFFPRSAQVHMVLIHSKANRSMTAPPRRQRISLLCG